MPCPFRLTYTEQVRLPAPLASSLAKDSASVVMAVPAVVCQVEDDTVVSVSKFSKSYVTLLCMQSLCRQYVWGKEFEPLCSFPSIFLFLLISTFHSPLLIVSFICTFLQHRTLLLNRWYSCFVSRSFQIAISDW